MEDKELREKLKAIAIQEKMYRYDDDHTILTTNGSILDLMQKAHDMDKWVPVGERLPEEDKEFNVCYKMPNGKWHVFTSGYSTSFKRFDFGNKNITHWQPLPKGPKQKD